MKRYFAILSVAFLVVMQVTGCSDDKGTEASLTAPVVTTTSPTNGATDVNLNPLIFVTFSKEMDAASLDSIYVSNMTVHHVEYHDTSKTAVVYIDS